MNGIGWVASDHYPLLVTSTATVVNIRPTTTSEKFFDDDDDVPSAPPICGSAQEINQGTERSPVSTKNDRNTLKTTSSAKPENDSGNRNPEKFVRTTATSEEGASSGLYPARLPTFHAIAPGPWHAVTAYDACVRLCLHAWAMECMEAPMFLESECALLRDAFGWVQPLLPVVHL
ncbi:hypothetical protein I3843_11G001100 [Carya illinoinensis]|nr:hypothetical protein I3843_11G001100 [Carya illinoinensis]